MNILAQEERLALLVKQRNAMIAMAKNLDGIDDDLAHYIYNFPISRWTCVIGSIRNRLIGASAFAAPTAAKPSPPATDTPEEAEEE